MIITANMIPANVNNLVIELNAKNNESIAKNQLEKLQFYFSERPILEKEQADNIKLDIFSLIYLQERLSTFLFDEIFYQLDTVSLNRLFSALWQLIVGLNNSDMTQEKESLKQGLLNLVKYFLNKKETLDEILKTTSAPTNHYYLDLIYRKANDLISNINQLKNLINIINNEDILALLKTLSQKIPTCLTTKRHLSFLIEDLEEQKTKSIFIFIQKNMDLFDIESLNDFLTLDNNPFKNSKKYLLTLAKKNPDCIFYASEKLKTNAYFQGLLFLQQPTLINHLSDETPSAKKIIEKGFVCEKKLASISFYLSYNAQKIAIENYSNHLFLPLDSDDKFLYFLLLLSNEPSTFALYINFFKQRILSLELPLIYNLINQLSESKNEVLFDVISDALIEKTTSNWPLGTLLASLNHQPKMIEFVLELIVISLKNIDELSLILMILDDSQQKVFFKIITLHIKTLQQQGFSLFEVLQQDNTRTLETSPEFMVATLRESNQQKSNKHHANNPYTFQAIKFDTNNLLNEKDDSKKSITSISR